MNRLVTRLANPLSRRQGFVLAVLALVMTASPLVVTLWLQASSNGGDSYDYETSAVVLGVAWTVGYLGLVPLLFATVALVGRPVRPAWLMPVAVAVALCQPIVHVLSTVQVVMMDIVSALLVVVVTGCSAGVLAVGLRGVEAPAQIPLAMVIAIGVSIAATAALMVLTAAFVSLTIAILLGVAIAQHRVRDGRASDDPLAESPPRRHTAVERGVTPPRRGRATQPSAAASFALNSSESK